MDSTQAIVPSGPVKLWLPGVGVTDLKIRAVAKAVEQYDAALRLARHEVYGDWVVVIGDQGHPVFGFGKELPRPEDVERILSQHDMKRHGRKIMDQLAVEAERKRLDSKYRTDEQNWAVAEVMEDKFLRDGNRMTSRIFVPGVYRGRS